MLRLYFFYEICIPEIFILLFVELAVVLVEVEVNLEVRVRFVPVVCSVEFPEVIPVSSSHVFEPRSMELDAIFNFLPPSKLTSRFECRTSQ